MIYKVELKPGAIKDLQSLPRDATKQLLSKIEALQNDLVGDVKRLTKYYTGIQIKSGEVPRIV